MRRRVFGAKTCCTPIHHSSEHVIDHLLLDRERGGGVKDLPFNRTLNWFFQASISVKANVTSIFKQSYGNNSLLHFEMFFVGCLFFWTTCYVISFEEKQKKKKTIERHVQTNLENHAKDSLAEQWMKEIRKLLLRSVKRTTPERPSLVACQPTCVLEL